MRSQTAWYRTPGLMIHTPKIIIKLLLESMRNQAVSTLLMRSVVMTGGSFLTMAISYLGIASIL